jgi:drug/metabolite transporter (DMT)-like permease
MLFYSLSWSFKVSSSSVYLLALASNLFFSTASLIFSIYSKKFSPWWVNQLKVMVAIVLFGVATLFTSTVAISWQAVGYLMLSGFIGLCIGDLFLFRAYTTLGAGRSLVLFSFQPLLLGVYGWLFLSQGFTLYQGLAVACMMSCLFVFLLERNKLTGRWDLMSFFWAFSGIVLDALGVMLTRESYEMTSGLDSMQVNLIRCSGAMLGFLTIRPKTAYKVLADLFLMPKKESSLILLACFSGTFLSLSLYLTALKYAHVASLTAVAITGPVWVSLLECLWERKLPNRYLSSAFMLFLLGFTLMSL